MNGPLEMEAAIAEHLAGQGVTVYSMKIPPQARTPAARMRELGSVTLNDLGGVVNLLTSDYEFALVVLESDDAWEPELKALAAKFSAAMALITPQSVIGTDPPVRFDSVVEMGVSSRQGQAFAGEETLLLALEFRYAINYYSQAEPPT